MIVLETEWTIEYTYNLHVLLYSNFLKSRTQTLRWIQYETTAQETTDLNSFLQTIPQNIIPNIKSDQTVLSHIHGVKYWIDHVYIVLYITSLNVVIWKLNLKLAPPVTLGGVSEVLFRTVPQTILTKVG